MCLRTLRLGWSLIQTLLKHGTVPTAASTRYHDANYKEQSQEIFLFLFTFELCHSAHITLCVLNGDASTYSVISIPSTLRHIDTGLPRGNPPPTLWSRVEVLD